MESSATGTRGTLTIPASIASISEKSETTQGKSVPFGVARAAQKKRRGRQVIDSLYADFRFDRLDARYPNTGLFIALLGFETFIARQASPPRRPASGGSNGGPRR